MSRHGRRRSTSFVGAMVALALLVAATAVWRNQHPAHAQSATATPAVIIQKAKASYAAPASDQGVLTIMALGSDVRPGEPGCGCSDSIHLITINPQKRAGTILGIPRDSWVDIPGHGMNKITTALHFGGPDLVAQVLEKMTGLHVDYYLTTEFHGFSTMVDGIGGIDVNVPTAMNDRYSGAVFSPGVVHMRGGGALAFARDRHDFASGDITRSQNQGLLFLAALAKLHKDFEHDPASLVGWVAVGMRNVQTDLTIPDLMRLALAAARVPVASISNLVAPATIGNVGSASVVFITSAAEAVFADMRDDGILNR